MRAGYNVFVSYGNYLLFFNSSQCPHFSCPVVIDNGLKVISNLAPVSSTLRILRICDQVMRFG